MTRAGAAGSALALLVLVAAFLGPGVFWDRSLLVGDGLYYTDPSFRAVAPDAFTTRPSNFLVDIDNTLQAYPFRHFIQSSLARGDIPWWNPYLAMGVPFVGLGAGVFEPLTVLLGLVVSPTKLGNALAVTGFFVGAAGMFGFLGALGASRPARALGTVTFVFGGWTVVWLGRPNFLAAIWMPWTFWAAERFLRRPGAGRAAALALSSALVCLPAYLQASFHIVVALALYVAVRLAGATGSRRRRAAVFVAFGLAVSLGVVATAFQIVPILDFVAQSDLPPQGRSRQLAVDGPGAALAAGLRGEWATLVTEGPTILTALSPHFFGAPQTDPPWWWPWSNFVETTVYVGVLPLGFALYGLVRRRDGRGIGVWWLLAALALAVAYALPLANLVNYLPGFRLANNGRLRLVFHFAVTVAAALGLDRFVAAAEVGPGLRRLAWPAAWAGLTLALPLAAWAWLTAWLDSARGPGFTTLLVRIVLPVGVVLAGFLAATLAWARARLGARAWCALVVGLAFAELFWFLHDFNPSIPSAYVFPPTSITRVVLADSTRPRVSSASVAEFLPPNTKLPYGIYDIDLFSVLAVDRYAALQRAIGPPPPAGRSTAFRTFAFRDPSAHRGLIDLMGVGYVVVPARGPDPFAVLERCQLVYSREVKIYRNLDALPRALLVERAVTVDTPSAALAAVTAPGFDPRALVVLEDPDAPRLADPGRESAGAPVRGATPTALTLVALENNRVVLRATAARPSYLVLAEVYYPGWRAWVDGVETPVYRADYLFRAIYVAPGRHDIVFLFAPRRYALAAAASAGAAAVIGACFAWEGVRRRRGPPRAGGAGTPS